MLCSRGVEAVLDSLTRVSHIFRNVSLRQPHTSDDWKYNSWGVALKVIPVFIKSDV